MNVQHESEKYAGAVRRSCGQPIPVPQMATIRLTAAEDVQDFAPLLLVAQCFTALGASHR
jgi:hypothetical protein